jgi:hypothetical protein
MADMPVNLPYFEAPGAGSAPLRPGDLVGACLEQGTDSLLLEDGALPAEFFDLSSGVAGDLLQKIANYGLRMAAVVPDPGAHSEPFQDLAREASRVGHFRFFRTRAEAVEWLGGQE